MNNLKSKLVRYSSAAGALLAVSGGAQAGLIKGTFSGSDGDNILNHHMDRVNIDMNNDGIDDFMGIMLSSFYSDSYYSNGTWYYTYFSIKISEIGYYMHAGSSEYFQVDNNSQGPFFLPRIKKYNLQEEIGPLKNPNNYGIISAYSHASSPSYYIPATPTGPSFFNHEDFGYIGVTMPLSDKLPHYGWIQIEIDSDGSVEFQDAGIDDRSYINQANQETGVPVYAGGGTAVPLLPIASAAGLGLVGLMAALKRKKNKNA